MASKINQQIGSVSGSGHNILQVTNVNNYGPLPSDALTGTPEREIVFPTNFELVREQLARKHKLVLIGPPGAGKTQVALYLVHVHESCDKQFKIVSGDKGLEYVREWLFNSKTCLFFLEDPWGRHRIENEAVLWAAEIPKLLKYASETKKFLIVSRAGILKQGLGEEERLVSESEVVLDEEDYTDRMRREILRLELTDAMPEQRDIAEIWASEIVRELRSPWSISFFASLLKEQPPRREPNVKQLIRDSKIGAIGRTVARVMTTGNVDIVRGSMLLWALFMSGRPVTEAGVEEARRGSECSGGTTVNPDGALLRLKQWQWAKKDADGVYRIHPTILEGLELIVKNPEHKAAAERTISALLEGETSAGRVEHAFAVLKRIDGLGIAIPPTVQTAIDRYLPSFLKSTEGSGFRYAFFDLADFGHGSDPVSFICRTLRSGRRGQFSTMEQWLPPEVPPEVIDSVRESADARYCVMQWIENVLPDSMGFLFIKPIRLLKFFALFEWDFSASFVAAAKDVMGSCQVSAPISLLIEAALTTDNPDFPGIFAAIQDARSRSGAQEPSGWDQAEFDSEYVDHLSGQTGEEIDMTNTALRTAVRLRRLKQGYEWILGDPNLSTMLEDWAEALDPTATIEEVGALIAACPRNEHRIVWIAIRNARCREFAEELLKDLETASLKHMSELLHALAIIFSSDADWDAIVMPRLLQLSHVRRAEIYYGWNPRDAEDVRLQDRMAETTIELPMRVALRACERRASRGVEPQAPLSLEARTSLRMLVSESSDVLAQAAATKLAEAGDSVTDLLNHLLTSSDPNCRATALNLWDFGRRAELEILREALNYCDYRVREVAIKKLAPFATPEDRLVIFSMSKDKSAPCREACAVVIGEHRWSEGIPVLLSLLADTRDDGCGTQDTRCFHVARAAAAALNSFSQLDPSVCERILEFLQLPRSYNDLYLCTNLLDVLGDHADDRSIPLFGALLESPYHVYDSHEGSGFPLRYAAAKALVRHLATRPSARERIGAEVLYKAAVHSDTQLASEALIALGLLGTRADNYLKKLPTEPGFTIDRAILAGCGRRLSGLDDIPVELENFVGHSHPSLRLLNIGGSRLEISKEGWLALFRDNAELRAWIHSLEAESDFKTALRGSLGWLLGAALAPQAKLEAG